MTDFKVFHVQKGLADSSLLEFLKSKGIIAHFDANHNELRIERSNSAFWALELNPANLPSKVTEDMEDDENLLRVLFYKQAKQITKQT